jgi:hypothetical protein
MADHVSTFSLDVINQLLASFHPAFKWLDNLAGDSIERIVPNLVDKLIAYDANVGDHRRLFIIYPQSFERIG